MRLILAAVGRLKRGPERDLAARYGERASKAGRAIGIRAVTISDIDEGRARRASDRLAEEATALRAVIPAQAAVIALDERGEALTSEELAQRIGRWRDQGPANSSLVRRS